MVDCSAAESDGPAASPAAGTVGGPQKVIYKVALTGGKAGRKNATMTTNVPANLPGPPAGPCAGKTSALVRLRTFFEGIGWKVRKWRFSSLLAESRLLHTGVFSARDCHVAARVSSCTMTVGNCVYEHTLPGEGWTMAC